MKELEAKLGYEFKNKQLLQKALTHSSYANEKKDRGMSNERLEFLGDSVLSIITAEYLCDRYLRQPEGELTKIRAALVCEQSLHIYSNKLELFKYVKLGKGEEQTGGRKRASLLADAFEAVLAAIYLDSGLESAKKFLTPFLEEYTPQAVKGKTFKDYKTIIQEIIQKNPGEQLSYVLVGEEGPDHSKIFVSELHLNSNVIGTGRGKSKKDAEQDAAKQALELMGL